MSLLSQARTLLCRVHQLVFPVAELINLSGRNRVYLSMTVEDSCGVIAQSGRLAVVSSQQLLFLVAD